jgi:hypothetical protein
VAATIGRGTALFAVAALFAIGVAGMISVRDVRMLERRTTEA